MLLAQRFAQVFGVIYLVIGILGFIPIAPILVPIEMAGPYGGVIGPFEGFLLGLFPVNWLHNLAHIAIGVAGLASYRSLAGARSYALVIGVLYIVLAVVGLFLPTFFGLLPLGGLDITLHALTAILALGAYFASPRGAVRPAA
jgi:hypothetical protein